MRASIRRLRDAKPSATGLSARFRIARAHLGPGARQAHAVERAPARGARLRGEPALAGRFHPGERHHRARGDRGDGSHGSRVWIRGRSPEDASDSIDPGRTCECRSRRRGMCRAGEHRARPNRAWVYYQSLTAPRKVQTNRPGAELTGRLSSATNGSVGTSADGVRGREFTPSARFAIALIGLLDWTIGGSFAHIRTGTQIEIAFWAQRAV